MSFQDRVKEAKLKANNKTTQRKEEIASLPPEKQESKMAEFEAKEAAREERLVASLGLLSSLMDKIQPPRWVGGKISKIKEPDGRERGVDHGKNRNIKDGLIPDPEKEEVLEDDIEETKPVAKPVRRQRAPIVFDDSTDVRDTSDDDGEEIVIRRRKRKPKKQEVAIPVEKKIEQPVVKEEPIIEPVQTRPDYAALFGM